MLIALDVSGGDFGAAPNVEGALSALKKYQDCSIILVGKGQEIRKELASRGAQEGGRISIVDAPETVEMEEEPVEACKQKKNSSIMVSCRLVAEGKAQGTVSMGNSGASMVASFLEMGRLPGISRPAIAVPLPTKKGISVLIDGGANTDCKPLQLLQFGVMGSVYAKNVLKIDNPSVGILSVGEEDTKGNALVKETIPLFKHSGLNFFGPIEGRDIPQGTTDVVVCDGFTGNICLKLSEGMAKTLVEIIKEQLSSNPIYMAGGLLSRGAFSKIKKMLDPHEHGGAPLLGVNGVSIIGHGKSNDVAVYNAIRVARELVLSDANSIIRREVTAMRDAMDKAKAATAADEAAL